MKTLAFALGLGLILAAPLTAQERRDSFLEVGKRYELTYFEEENQRKYHHPTDVYIVQEGTNQWYLVETIKGFPNSRIWLNFAGVLSVKEKQPEDGQ